MNLLLRTRDGRLLLAAQAVSFLAHGISSVALPWLVLDASGSAGAAGLVFTFTVIPYVVFGLAAGVVGDRFPQRRVIWLTHALQALVALAVPLWSLGGGPPVAFVLAAAFAIGAGRVFSDAGVFGVLAAIVGRDRVTQGQATLGAAWAVGLLVGPALGGVLITVIGPARSLIVEAGGLALAALVVRSMDAGSELRHDAAATNAAAIVRNGLRTIFGQPVLRAVTILGVAWSIPAATAWALAIPLLREDLALGSRGAGTVIAAGAAMGILAPAIVGLLEPRIGGVRILVYGVPVAALATAAFGLSPGFATALAAYCAMELATTVTTAAYIGERQRRAPLALQSTVGIFGRMIIMVSLALGSALGSGLTAAVSLRALYVGAGLAILAVSAVMAVVLTRVVRSEGAADPLRAT